MALIFVPRHFKVAGASALTAVDTADFVNIVMAASRKAFKLRLLIYNWSRFDRVEHVRRLGSPVHV